MVKKIQESEKVWVIVSSEGLIDSYPTLYSAQSQAKDYLDENDTVEDVFIFEVVKAWRVEFPQEPQAEVREVGLGVIP